MAIIGHCSRVCSSTGVQCSRGIFQHQSDQVIGNKSHIRAIGDIHISAVFQNLRSRAAGGNVKITSAVHDDIIRRASVVGKHTAGIVDNSRVRLAAGNTQTAHAVHDGRVRHTFVNLQIAAAVHRGRIRLAAIGNKHAAATFHDSRIRHAAGRYIHLAAADHRCGVRLAARGDEYLASVFNGGDVRHAAIGNKHPAPIGNNSSVRHAAGINIHAAQGNGDSSGCLPGRYVVTGHYDTSILLRITFVFTNKYEGSRRILHRAGKIFAFFGSPSESEQRRLTPSARKRNRDARPPKLELCVKKTKLRGRKIPDRGVFLCVLPMAYFIVWATATATSTDAPTIGLLPMPISPIISTCAGTDEEPANCASECIRPIVSVMP